MKKLIIFTGIILGIIFFIQCNKTTEVSSYQNDNMLIQNQSSFENNIQEDISVLDVSNCRLEDVPGFSCVIHTEIRISVVLDPNQINIPPEIIGDCVVWAVFDIKECNNNNNNNDYLVGFRNFRLDIPIEEGCGDLNTYLDNLENSDVDAYNDLMDDIRLYVANAGKEKYMIDMVKSTPINCPHYSADAYLFLKNCYKKCLESPKMIKVCGPQIGNYQCKDPHYEMVVGEYHYLACGDACCMSKQSYCYDPVNDIVIIGDKIFSQLGTCDDNTNEVCLGEYVGGAFCITGGCN